MLWPHRLRSAQSPDIAHNRRTLFGPQRQVEFARPCDFEKSGVGVPLLGTFLVWTGFFVLGPLIAIPFVDDLSLSNGPSGAPMLFLTWRPFAIVIASPLARRRYPGRQRILAGVGGRHGNGLCGALHDFGQIHGGPAMAWLTFSTIACAPLLPSQLNCL